MRSGNLLVLASVWILAGCVGVGAVVPAEWIKSGPDGESVWPPRVTPAAVLTKQATADGEIWTYTESNDWCGAFVVVVPLMLPLCEHTRAFTFRGEVLVQEKVRGTRYKGLMCSILPIEGRGGLCSIE